MTLIEIQACDHFRGVSIVTEIVVCDFNATRQERAPAQEQRVLEFALTA